MFLPRWIKIVFPALLCFRSAYAQPQWSDLTPPLAAHVYFVSASGSDTNPGTEVLPFRSVARGLAALQDGHPDQLRLRRGDEWSESINWANGSGDAKNPMVIGAYGTGPRPKLRTAGTAFYAAPANARTGLMIADLDLAPVSYGSAGIFIGAPWGGVTIEGCKVSGFSSNIVVQEINVGRLSGITVRNNVITDSYEPGTGHSQGLFCGSVDGLVIEGNVFDLNAADKRDIFCHNVYIHETCGEVVFRYNITARACSHGAQLRPGGPCEWNLSLQNPLGILSGGAAGVFCTFRYNVALDSQDISPIAPRGFGFDIRTPAGGDVSENTVAHNDHSTANLEGFNFGSATTAVVRNNVAYDWFCLPPGQVAWGHCFTGAVGVFQNNRAFQPRGGQCLYDAAPGAVYAGNRYGSASSNCFNDGTWAAWSSHEVGSGFGPSPVVDARISAYMASIGRSGGLAEFMSEARQLGRLSDRVEFRAAAVNKWVRSRFTCPADADGNGFLNVNDFNAFLNMFAAGDALANCDGSTNPPTLNVNDFNCFLNAFAVGCP